ncbi:MAG TPA: DUF4276 family protein [Aggregatilineales bacterium]|nr:DUF4276 family protein [Aggregatilineales bacterium]
MVAINIVVEGRTDLHVMRRIFHYVGHEIGKVRDDKSKPGLLTDIRKYEQAARYVTWLMLLDLDQDAACGAAYRQSLVSDPQSPLILRIAVRTIEAWIMADREHLAAFLKVSMQKIPAYPDSVEYPKKTLIEVVRTSRDKKLIADMVPLQSIGKLEGPNYEARIAEFMNHDKYPWRPEVAAQHSDSLARCIRSLKNWQPISKDSP